MAESREDAAPFVILPMVHEVTGIAHDKFNNALVSQASVLNQKFVDKTA